MPTPHQGGSPMKGPPAESETRDRLREIFRRIHSERAGKDLTIPLGVLDPSDEAGAIANWFSRTDSRLDRHEEALTLLVRLLPERSVTRVRAGDPSPAPE